MTRHDELVELMQALDLGAVRTDELIRACRRAVPDASEADVLAALYEVSDELICRLRWIRDGGILH